MIQKEHSTNLLVITEAPNKTSKSERTKIMILDAASEFIWSHPFHEMTVNALMSSTGISRSAFYRHFSDLHAVMKELLETLEGEIGAVVQPWFTGVGDPVALLYETMNGLIDICYKRGPFMQAISDAAATDKRFEEDWSQFLSGFDDLGNALIIADQKQGLIPNFDPRPVMLALNRMNAHTIIEAFGRIPRKKPEPVKEGLARVWISTLYGVQWCESKTSNLIRK